MPRVPRYDDQQVQARGISLVQGQRISGSTPNGFGALGAGLSDVADAIAQQQKHADDLRAEEAFNQLRERQLDLTFNQEGGYTNVKGRNALPAEGVSLSDRYTGQFQSAAAEIEGGLGSERQKQLFRQYAARASTEFRGGILRHENAQLESWRKETVQGVIAVEAETAARNWNNQEAIDLSRGRIDLNLARMREAEGLPADEVQRLRLQALGGLHAKVIDQAIAAKNLDYAGAYLKKYGDEIPAEVLLKASSLLGKEQDAALGQGVATEIARRQIAPSAQPSDMGRLVSLVMAQESGGRRYGTDGQLLTSPKGAKGEMQVLDGTNKDPGFGVTPAKDDSPDERARVGRDYLAAMVKRYGGNVAQALAAYNWGPGNVDKAIKEHGDAWLSKAPKETQEYVPAILSQFQAGAGAPKRATLAELEDDARNDPRLAGRPAALKAALDGLQHQHRVAEDGRKQRLDEAEGEVYRQLAANGGDFYAVPAGLRAQMDPTKLDTAMAFAKRLRSGEDVTTNPALYLELSDDRVLRSKTPAQLYALRSELSATDFKHFADRMNTLNDSGAKNKPGDIDSESVGRVLGQRLDSMGIQEKDNRPYVGALRMFIDRTILAEQQRTGKKLSDVEIVQHVDRLFAQNVQFRNTFLGMTTGTSSVALLSMKPGDVPGEARDQIKAAFKAAGREASDADVLQVYWQQKFANQRSALKQAKAPTAADQIPK